MAWSRAAARGVEPRKCSVKVCAIALLAQAIWLRSGWDSDTTLWPRAGPAEMAAASQRAKWQRAGAELTQQGNAVRWLDTSLDFLSEDGVVPVLLGITVADAEAQPLRLRAMIMMEDEEQCDGATAQISVRMLEAGGGMAVNDITQIPARSS